MDGLARAVALATVGLGAGAARGVVVMVLEPGGGVTIAEGLSRPTRHMCNALPTRLRGALGVIEALGSGYIGTLTGGVLGRQYSDIFAFAVLILVLTVRPQGLLGERVADRA